MLRFIGLAALPLLSWSSPQEAGPCRLASSITITTGILICLSLATWTGTPYHNKICDGDWHTYCPPGVFPATACQLFHNRGDGTSEDVTERSGLTAKKGKALGVAFADYDGDGFTDIFVSNDGMQQYLFHNNGDGTFTECALESGVALTSDGKGLSGMGTVFQDYDNDGRPDVLVTVLPREIYGLYHNEGGGAFNYASLETGLGALTSGSSGWGAGLEDFDNDGWKDLFVAQRHVLDNVQQIDASLRYKELPLRAMNHDGHFERADSGVTTPLAARCGVWRHQ